MTDISNLPKPVELVFVKIDPTSEDSSSKVPVVIYHGIFSGKESWTALGKEIATKTGRTVYCFDVRDHGDSPWTNEFTLQAMISDMVNFLNEKKIEKALFLGHSLGGLIFSRLATLFPNLVEKLILVDIHPKKRPSNEGGDGKGSNIVQLFAGMLKQTIQKIRSEKMDLETAKNHLEEMLRPYIKEEANRRGYMDKLTVRNGEVDWKFHLDALTEFLQLISKKFEDITPNYDGPVLEVYGSESVFITKDDCESVLKMLPNTKFERIEGADHVLHSTHPKEFIEKVVPFINE